MWPATICAALGCIPVTVAVCELCRPELSWAFLGYSTLVCPVCLCGRWPNSPGLCGCVCCYATFVLFGYIGIQKEQKLTKSVVCHHLLPMCGLVPSQFATLLYYCKPNKANVSVPEEQANCKQHERFTPQDLDLGL